MKAMKMIKYLVIMVMMILVIRTIKKGIPEEKHPFFLGGGGGGAVQIDFDTFSGNPSLMIAMLDLMK